jgi:Copper type II ascorbate-dependent monooxygenase, C-terminal domain
MQIRLTPVVVPAAQEREVCQAIELPNREAVDVAALQFATPGGRTYLSHHFALFVDDADTMATLPRGPLDSPGCAGFGQAFGAILAGVQSPRATVRFPSGVGFTLKPHQVVLLNLHYVNGSSKPLRVDGAVNLVEARPGTVTHHARAFQFGTARIAVPPGGDASAEASWTAPFPMNVVLLSTHSHKHTTSVDVDVVRSGDRPAPILETVDYRHPELKGFATPLRLEPGDGFRWTCNYHNAGPSMLTFGVTSNDEMCFTIGAFYLDDDAAPLPPVPDCYGGDIALTCPWS